MASWLESYRGAVMPWECDIVEHLTIAYYFERFADANLALMDHIGFGKDYRDNDKKAIAAVHCHVRFLEEMRAGDILHLESGVIGAEGKAVRMGHRVFNSATGALTTTMEQTSIHFDMAARKSLTLPDDKRRAVLEQIVEWDTPAPVERPRPDTDDGFVATVRDAAKPQELDALGHISFQCYVHRFSMAAMQAMAAFGMTPEYMRSQRRGMSTFEIDLRFLRELHAGDMVGIRSAIVHLGRSSFGLFHRMTNLRTGEVSAEMSQFGAHLDMDARRSTPLPDDLRRRAEDLLTSA
jgi:acyl-CoA thioesterase FadM